MTEAVTAVAAQVREEFRHEVEDQEMSEGSTIGEGCLQSADDPADDELGHQRNAASRGNRRRRRGCKKRAVPIAGRIEKNRKEDGQRSVIDQKSNEEQQRPVGEPCKE